ncbi:MAG: S-methyl-5-thioribose-1-phosphate isomerase [Candidatus Bathyarchaeota archaeon]|nr:MAG: S-methyl-5-thioribose-1-phosphate isomerase [Candidatus Bathyarchaeota archaeon]
MRTIEWDEGTVTIVDQTKLPDETFYLSMTKCDEVASAIQEMKVRGAPLIGVAAAYGLALTAYHSKAKTRAALMRQMETSAKTLKGTRPTAVNLFWAIDRVLSKARGTIGSAKTVARVVVDEARGMADEDVEINRKIGANGSKLICDGDVLLTHCNAGSLATVDYGTALGVIRTAWEAGRKIRVIATETRPRLQGARLTAYELKRDGIPVTLITDNMVGYAMSQRLINKVVVGADRIVRDAVVNKIGTYTIAVLAHEHGIPFYVAAPTSTFDLAQASQDVVIEERSRDEVSYIGSERVTPAEVDVLNPAFDITPMKYVSAIICETGVLSPAEFLQAASA